MKRLDKELTTMFLNAKKEAWNTRSAQGITTLDIFKELMDDPESLLYEYLIECSYNDIIEMELANAMLELKNAKNISYEVLYYLKKENGEEVGVLITQELFGYLKKADELAGKNEEVIADDLIAAIIKSPSRPITKFLRATSASIPELKELFDSAYQTLKDEIPEDMISYLSILEADNDVLGRDKEVDEVWTILLKKTKRNLILVGDPGIGKTAIVRKMVAQIKNGTAPKEFKDFKIYSLDVTSVISGTKYRGDAEEKYKQIIAFIQARSNAILFIDEAHMIIGAGRTENSPMDFANSLKPLLAGNHSRVIAATTTAEYEKYFTFDPALKRRLEKVLVKEPLFTEVYPMIAAKVKSLSDYHKVAFTPQMVEYRFKIDMSQK